MAATAGFYRRVLPSPPAIDFASTEGKQLFVEAIQNGTMEGFYRLISYFQTQSEPAYCGLASLSMVLNALAIDPGRKWKGPWRWFDESMLDCCEPLETVKAKGITFGKLVCLGQCAGAKVEAYRTSQSSIEDFRRQVVRCSSSDDCHVISSYHRGAFKQTGTGHFSPIGGYHAGMDMALILDVARFKYPPHWVPLTLLWQAMDNVDEATGQRRGFMLVSRPCAEPGLLFTLSCKHESWRGIAKFLMDDVPLLLRSEDEKNIDQVLSVILTSIPSNFEEFIKWVVEVRTQEDGVGNVSQEEKGRLSLKEELLKQVKQTALFKHVVSFFASEKSCCRNVPYMSPEKNLPGIAASVCCQGAKILAGNSVCSENYHCRETCIRYLKTNGDSHVTLVSGTVRSGSTEQGLDVLIPSSEKERNCCSCGPNDCIGRHPTGSDVLTALLLALPPEMLSGIQDAKLLLDMSTVFSTDTLPVLLREEVLHLRRQLHLLTRFQESKIDEDLGAPLI